MGIKRNDNPPDIVTLEKRVKSITKKEKWNEIEIIVGLLNTFTDGFNRIGTFKKDDNNETEYIWLLLSIRCLNSMMCAYHLMYSGYYSQAATIIRSITEDILICMACRTDKSVRDYIFDRNANRPIYRLLAKNNNAENVYAMYKHQCKLAHSSSLSLGVLIDNGNVKPAPVYDSMLFDYCLEAFILTSVMMAEYLGRVILYIDQNKAKSFNDDNANSLTKATKFLTSLKKKYTKEIENNQSQEE